MKRVRRHKVHIGAITGLAVLVLGCEPETAEQEDISSTEQPTQVRMSLSTEQENCLLMVVNECAHSEAFFDEQIGWDRRAAYALVNWRNGPDTVCGTDDDRRYKTIGQVAETPFVGDVAMQHLVNYGLTDQCVADAFLVIADGVLFSSWEARATLGVANTKTATVLTNYVKISPDVVAAVLKHRPFSTGDLSKGIASLAAVPGVGPATLMRLRDYAVYSGMDGLYCESAGEMASGVEFGPVEVHDVLDWANRAIHVELTAITGVGDVIAARIIEAREAAGDFLTIGGLDVIGGVGAGVLTHLREEILTLWCDTPNAQCGCEAQTVADSTALDAGLTWLDEELAEPKQANTKRFLSLLGKESYERLAAVIRKQLVQDLVKLEPELTGLSLTAVQARVAKLLEKRLDQDVFLAPFTLIEPTKAMPGSLPTAVQKAVDHILMALVETDLEESMVGASFAELVSGEGQAFFLADIVNWRTAHIDDGSTVTCLRLSHSWILSGEFLGLPTEVTVSRFTGDVLGVVIEVDW